MYENKFDNLRNQQTQQPQHRSNKIFSWEVFPLWIGVAHYHVPIQHQQRRHSILSLKLTLK